jgi:hypothetical protein
MFNNSNGYSLSDIAAATGGGMDGFGNNSAWWIIVLFLFAFGGWGGNGWGNNGNGYGAGAGGLYPVQRGAHAPGPGPLHGIGLLAGERFQPGHLLEQH